MKFYSLKVASDFACKLESRPEFDSSKFEIEIRHVSTKPDIYDVVVLPALNLEEKLRRRNE